MNKPVAGSGIETEIKLRVESAAKTLKMLRGLDYKVIKSRVFEQNLVLDDAAGTLREQGKLLRVRGAGKLVTCTFKGLEKPGRHKSREEREFRASDLDEALGVFGGLGYDEVFRYEKYRTELSRVDEPGHVTVDETPMGAFMELEGPARWIDRTAKSLGFRVRDYILESYGTLWEQWCEEHGTTGDMRFSR